MSSEKLFLKEKIMEFEEEMKWLLIVPKVLF